MMLHVRARAAVQWIFEALTSGGVYVMVERKASSHLEDNIAKGTQLHCPQSRVQG